MLFIYIYIHKKHFLFFFFLLLSFACLLACYTFIITHLHNDFYVQIHDSTPIRNKQEKAQKSAEKKHSFIWGAYFRPTSMGGGGVDMVDK